MNSGICHFEGDIFWSLKHDCYVPIKAHYMWIAWQEQQKKINDIEAENAALKRNQENSVKMFKELLIMLDKVAEK